MIPVFPALALAFLSFFASVFVILRIIIPILPPHPLSKRVAPAEFGLPNFQKLSPADKAHVWLASLDIIALAVFVWQVVDETRGGPSGFTSASDTASSIRLWVVLTIRQTMLLVIVALTLLHVRLGRPISFGGKHWVLWAPSLVLVTMSTALVGILSGAGVNSLFYGLIAYTSTITAVTLITFTFLLSTLFIIKRNLNAINEQMDPWPPARETLEKPRPSFATEDIGALREGGSWISSNSGTSSRHCSISAWSFSTQHSANGHGRPQTGGHHSVSAKSTYWLGTASREDVPPVPPLPPPYGQASPCLAESDTCHRDLPRPRLGSQTSWLTSTDDSHSTISAWSFPTTRSEPSICVPSIRDCHTPSTLVSQPDIPAMGSVQVLGGHGFNPNHAEKGVFPCSSPSSRTVGLDTSLIRNAGWFLFILVPYTFSLPYLGIVSQNHPCSLVVSIFFTLSILLSSPILAFNVIFKCSFPIPTGLFNTSSQFSPLGLPKPENLVPPGCSFEPKHSMTTSVTVVEDRRSGDVWIAKGDAIDSKGKFGRAIEALNPCPKLSVIPPRECVEEPLTLPLSIHDEFTPSTSLRSIPKNAGGDRRRTESKASSHLSGDECLAITSKIMVAQRHYSALAQTVILPSTPPEREGVKATGAATKRASGHLRSRSITSATGPSTPTPAGSFKISPTPPPPFPLPPTPSSVRQARLALTHKKSFSSGLNFNRVNITEINALTAGVLPLLTPGLRVGDGVGITNEYSLESNGSRSHGMRTLKKINEFGFDFSLPQIASTPARRPRHKKPEHRQKHYSFPGLDLGKGGTNTLSMWGVDTCGTIENRVSQYEHSTIPSNVEAGRRNTVFGAGSIPNTNPHTQIHEPSEDQDDTSFLSPLVEANFSHATSNRTLRVDIFGDLDPARLSLVGSVASTVTLFDDNEADFATGPVAESTPHNSITQKKAHKQPPPPLPLGKHTMAHKRSSIVYIKSQKSIDDIANATPPDAESTAASTMTSLAQWPRRAVKPLAPKTSKLQSKTSNASSVLTGAKSGLRPLTLLQGRDINTAPSFTVSSETRPLSFGKKQKHHRAARENEDENSDPNTSLRSHDTSRKLKPLTLARSETPKMRGILRQTEVPPQVTVRPPSETEHAGFVCSFHDN